MKCSAHAAMIALACAMSLSTPGWAQVIAGGAPMYANKDIIDNAADSEDHTTLVTAVGAAGLVEILKDPGPFAVFAPVITDADGGMVHVTTPDVIQSNSVIHMIDRVLLPKQVMPE